MVLLKYPPVIHLVVVTTNLPEPFIPKNQITAKIWNLITKMWVRAYMRSRFPFRRKLLNYVSNYIRQNSEIYGITFEEELIENPSSKNC